MAFVRDVLEGELSSADDRIHLDPGGPPQAGVVPHLRLGNRWFNTIWLIPLGAVLLLAAIAISRELRTYPAVEQFIARYPGTPASAPAVHSGFPAWLRWQHFLNLFFLMFIMRSGLQILASHPRLYWKRFDAGHRVVPLSARGAEGSHLDGQRRCGRAAESRRAARSPVFGWAGQMVAFFL